MCAQIGFQGQRTSMLNYLPSWGQRECQRRRFRVINSVLERVGKETIKFSRNADEYSWGVFLCERSFITCNISHPNMMSLLKNERPWLEEGPFPFLFPFCVILKKKAHTHRILPQRYLPQKTWSSDIFAGASPAELTTLMLAEDCNQTLLTCFFLFEQEQKEFISNILTEVENLEAID